MFKSSFHIYLIIFIILLTAACSKGSKTKYSKGYIENERKEIRSMLARSSELFGYEDSLDEVIQILEIAHDKANKINDVKSVVQTAERLGGAYTAVSDLPAAAGYYYTALKHAESLRDTAQIANSKVGLGLIMFTMNKSQEAIGYFRQSLQLHTEDQINKHTIGLIKYLTGLSYAKLNKPQKARAYLKQAQGLATDLKDSGRLSEIRLSLNNLKLEEELNEEVLEEYNDLYREFKKNDEKVGMSYALEGMARYYLKKGDAKRAQTYANQSLDLVEQMNLIYPLQSILEIVTEAELKNKDFAAASAHLIDLQAAKDSIQGLNAAAKVTLLSADYKFDKEKKSYDLVLTQQRRKNAVWIAVAGGLFLVVLMIFYLLRAVSKERKRSDSLLLNILPEHTARELKKFGRATAKTHRNVTIVFADIKNFTIIADGLGANVIVLMLDKYFKALDAIVEEYKVEKIKTIGDAYMFVAGLNTASINSAGLAVETSLKMIEKIEKTEYSYGYKLWNTVRL